MREAALFVILLLVGTGVGIALTAPRAATNGDEMTPASVSDPLGPMPHPATAAKAQAQHSSLFARSVRAATHPIHLNDSLGTTAAVCPAFSSMCTSFPGSDKRSVLLGRGDDFGAFDINVTWSPSGPLTQRLDVVLRACQATCRGGEPVLASVQGIAPLRLHDDLPFVPTGERIYLEVASSMPGPTIGAGLRANTPQSFHVDGVIREPVA